MKKCNQTIKSAISLALLAVGLACFACPALAQSPTPPGLLITPTALPHAVQQDLKPGFALPYFATNYPNFVAGEAVKAVVSPDGKTLAILSAGMNSLYFPNTCEPGTPNCAGRQTAKRCMPLAAVTTRCMPTSTMAPVSR